MPAYLGALDQGTTSTRFIVFDRSGRIVASAQEEHEQIYSSPGWVEHDPDEIWRRTQDVIREAMEQKILQPSDLAAIGITNQRETVVLWDKNTARPLCNAVVWQDTRVEGMVGEFARQGGIDRFRAQDRPAPFDIFQRPENSLDSREHPGCSKNDRLWRNSLRHHGHLSCCGVSQAASTEACTSPTSRTPAAHSS